LIEAQPQSVNKKLATLLLLLKMFFVRIKRKK